MDHHNKTILRRELHHWTKIFVREKGLSFHVLALPYTGETSLKRHSVNSQRIPGHSNAPTQPFMSPSPPHSLSALTQE